MRVWMMSFLILPLLLLSCREGGLNPTNCRNGKCTYAFKTGKQLTLEKEGQEEFVKISPGQDKIFIYQYEFNDRENIADDEYTERILLQIPDSLDSFEFEGATLQALAVFMVPSCFCPPEVGRIIDGKISGQQLSEDKWELDVDVRFTNFGSEVERSFVSTFEFDPN